MALPLVPLLLSAGVIAGTYALGKRAQGAPAPGPAPVPVPVVPRPPPAPAPDNGGGGFIPDILPTNILQPLPQTGRQFVPPGFFRPGYGQPAYYPYRYPLWRSRLRRHW